MSMNDCFNDSVLMFCLLQEGMQSVFKSQVREIEQEVRKRDMLIEVLQTRIQELQVGIIEILETFSQVFFVILARGIDAKFHRNRAFCHNSMIFGSFHMMRDIRINFLKIHVFGNRNDCRLSSARNGKTFEIILPS